MQHSRKRVYVYVSRFHRVKSRNKEFAEVPEVNKQGKSVGTFYPELCVCVPHMLFQQEYIRKLGGLKNLMFFLFYLLSLFHSAEEIK